MSVRIHDYEEAIKFVKQAIDISHTDASDNKSDKKQNDSDASLYLLLGSIYQKHGDYDRASSCYNTTIEKDPHCVEAYNNLLLDRLNDNIWKDHLKNLPAFIQWKLEQKPENENEPGLALRDIDKDGWALLYENACRAEMMKNPPALPAGVVMPRELTEEEKERKKNAETDEEVSKQIVNNSTEEKSYKPAMIALLQQKKLVLGGIERKLGETYINVEAALKENLITDADLKDYAYSPVYNIVANAIALDIVERREDHKVPGGLSFWVGI